jgi:hypothetical protein
MRKWKAYRKIYNFMIFKQSEGKARGNDSGSLNPPYLQAFSFPMCMCPCNAYMCMCACAYPHGLAWHELVRFSEVQESAVRRAQVGDLEAVAGEMQCCVVA